MTATVLPAPPSYTDPEFALLPDGRRVERIEDIIRARAAATPDGPALTDADGVVTFGELDRASNRVANALLRLGVEPEERVCYIGPSDARFLEVLYGASKMGAVFSATNIRLKAEEIRYILADLEPSVVVLGAGFEVLAELADEATSATVVTSADGDWLDGAAEEDPGYARACEAVALILYSSGTTGRPKGVQLPAEGFGRGLAAMHYLMGFDTSSVAHAPLPFFHISGLGLALASNLNGANLLLLGAGSTADLCRLMQEHRVSHTVMVPTVVSDLLQLTDVGELDWSALKYITYGAAAMPESLLRQAIDTFGCDFLQSYGLTEATGGVTMLTAEDHRLAAERPHLLRSIGRPMPQTPIKVVDTVTLRDVPAGVSGEIVVGGARVMVGYWHNDAATAEAMLPGGWLRTGDGGWIDDDGYVFLHDRIKDMIISGGENVYPAEVENVALQHPGIAQVAVVGVPSERWGESPIAIVVRAAGFAGDVLAADDLVAWLRHRLAHFKCPATVVFVDELPRNASGKVLKHVLRDDYREVLG